MAVNYTEGFHRPHTHIILFSAKRLYGLWLHHKFLDMYMLFYFPLAAYLVHKVSDQLHISEFNRLVFESEMGNDNEDLFSTIIYFVFLLE